MEEASWWGGQDRQQRWSWVQRVALSYHGQTNVLFQPTILEVCGTAKTVPQMFATICKVKMEDKNRASEGDKGYKLQNQEVECSCSYLGSSRTCNSNKIMSRLNLAKSNTAQETSSFVVGEIRSIIEREAKKKHKRSFSRILVFLCKTVSEADSHTFPPTYSHSSGQWMNLTTGRTQPTETAHTQIQINVYLFL